MATAATAGLRQRLQLRATTGAVSVPLQGPLQVPLQALKQPLQLLRLGRCTPSPGTASSRPRARPLHSCSRRPLPLESRRCWTTHSRHFSPSSPPSLFSSSFSSSSPSPSSTTNQHTSAAAAATATMVAEDFEAVLKGKYPANAHARRVVDLIRSKIPDANGVLYLEARHTKMLEDNDSPEHFRQRRFFYYLTGCNLADCHYAYDIQSAKSTLFIPPIDPEDVVWSGLPVTIDDVLKLYDVDEVKLTTEVNATLAHLAHGNSKSAIYAIDGQVSDHVTFIEFQNKDFTALKEAIEVSRVVKDEFEVAMLRKANHVSSLAHKAVLEKARNADNERELEAAFLERCVAHGAKEMSYHPIVAAGRAAATLHYVPNDAPLGGKLNLLLDAGAEWNNYAADITRTFPLNGKFTKESREIYEIAYKMQKECIASIKAGMVWDDLHVLAHKIAIDGLLALGILKGDKDEIFNARISQAFFPHGLGHYLGMDTHDTGGNHNRKDPDEIFRNLRLRGKVPAGGVVTVEPGVYFCNFIIDPYLKHPEKSKFIDAAVLEKYWDVGGVRIEDNILVTETGYENLTTAIKEPAEIEALMAAN